MLVQPHPPSDERPHNNASESAKNDMARDADAMHHSLEHQHASTALSVAEQVAHLVSTWRDAGTLGDRIGNIAAVANLAGKLAGVVYSLAPRAVLTAATAPDDVSAGAIHTHKTLAEHTFGGMQQVGPHQRSAESKLVACLLGTANTGRLPCGKAS